MPASDSPGPSTRRWTLIAAVAAGTAVLLAVALAVTIAGRLGEDRPRASVGEIILPPDHEPVPSDAGTVDLPWGSVSVSVGDVTDEVPEALEGRSAVAPPDGGSFVRVTLQPTQKKEGPPPFVHTGKPWQSRAEVVLTADDEEYRIDGRDGLEVTPDSPTPKGGHSRWVAVDGDPSDLSVTVTVDGEEQVIEADGSVSRGKAAALDDVPSQLRKGTSSACGSVKQSGSPTMSVQPSDMPECTLDASVRTPFVDGLGWAAKGKEYLVVQVSYDHRVDVTSKDDVARVIDTRLTARLDGVLPEGRVTDGGPVLGTSAMHGSMETVIFEVPVEESNSTLSLRLDFEGTPEDPFVSEKPERGRLTWTIPGEELT